MLKDYPVKFDDVTLYQWNKWEESYDVVENTYQTEAGTDQSDVVRYDKLTVSCEYRCHSDKLAMFKRFSKQDTIKVTMYDGETDGYKERTMRMRDYKASPIEYSENMKDTNGVWNVSFSLIEF